MNRITSSNHSENYVDSVKSEAETAQRPIDIAREMFNKEREIAVTNGHKWEHGTFDECLQDYMRNGWVVSNHLFFVMAKATQLRLRGGGVEELSRKEESSQPLNPPQADQPSQLLGAWYVCFAIGALPMLLHSMPIRQPLIAFKRRDTGRLRVYDMDRFIRATRTCLALNNPAVLGT